MASLRDDQQESQAVCLVASPSVNPPVNLVAILRQRQVIFRLVSPMVGLLRSPVTNLPASPVVDPLESQVVFRVESQRVFRVESQVASLQGCLFGILPLSLVADLQQSLQANRVADLLESPLGIQLWFQQENQLGHLVTNPQVYRAGGQRINLVIDLLQGQLIHRPAILQKGLVVFQAKNQVAIRPANLRVNPHQNRAFVRVGNRQIFPQHNLLGSHQERLLMNRVFGLLYNPEADLQQCLL